MVFDFKLGHYYCILFDFLVDEFCFGSTDADFLRESYLKVSSLKFHSYHRDRLDFLRSIGISGEILNKLIRKKFKFVDLRF